MNVTEYDYRDFERNKKIIFEAEMAGDQTVLHIMQYVGDDPINDENAICFSVKGIYAIHKLEDADELLSECIRIKELTSDPDDDEDEDGYYEEDE